MNMENSTLEKNPEENSPQTMAEVLERAYERIKMRDRNIPKILEIEKIMFSEGQITPEDIQNKIKQIYDILDTFEVDEGESKIIGNLRDIVDDHFAQRVHVQTADDVILKNLGRVEHDEVTLGVYLFKKRVGSKVNFGLIRGYVKEGYFLVEFEYSGDYDLFESAGESVNEKIESEGLYSKCGISIGGFDVDVIAINKEGNIGYEKEIFTHEKQHFINHRVLSSDDFGNPFGGFGREYREITQGELGISFEKTKDELLARVRDGRFDTSFIYDPTYSELTKYLTDEEKEKIFKILESIEKRKFNTEYLDKETKKKASAYFTYQLIDIPFERIPAQLRILRGLAFRRLEKIENSFSDLLIDNQSHRLLKKKRDGMNINPIHLEPPDYEIDSNYNAFHEKLNRLLILVLINDMDDDESIQEVKELIASIKKTKKEYDRLSEKALDQYEEYKKMLESIKK